MESFYAAHKQCSMNYMVYNRPQSMTIETACTIFCWSIFNSSIFDLNVDTFLCAFVYHRLVALPCLAFSFALSWTVELLLFV